ncbi:hypothetical protein BD408DRAFT_426923 [Parasitella parasitica]|nr:hypothetical protein BD408DRAFT_426923 [Parasitella parasitica]
MICDSWCILTYSLFLVHFLPNPILNGPLRVLYYESLLNSLKNADFMFFSFFCRHFYTWIFVLKKTYLGFLLRVNEVNTLSLL